ncbi:hypothetical protein IB257_25020 [Achromobacter sp. ACM03]|uniref:hypothetical protein n=1 Tax=Achromobacter sp. ACM03 TaxID=2769300 RepID=UPI00177DD0B7|nr:hypothetical protein [Achromobacter sp. ACM03]MBD9433213.1 hypothetical protein [Achromobacter sp. ACM03]
MNTTTVWKLVPAAPNQDWTNAFAARGPRIGTFDTTIRDVLTTAPAPAFNLQDALQGVRAALAFLPPGDAAIAGLDRIIAIFGAAPGGAEDDTPARTGNTAKEQDMFAAGLEAGEANAKDNAAIRAAASAPSSPGDAQDERGICQVDVLDIARETGLRSYLHGVNAMEARMVLQRFVDALPAAGDALALPELNADLIDILGRPNFTCIRIAQLLRLSGVEIKKKAEAEQATVIHYLLGFYLKHGSQWAEKAGEDIERLRLAAIAAQQGKGGEA